jgi:hypothetical protein
VTALTAWCHLEILLVWRSDVDDLINVKSIYPNFPMNRSYLVAKVADELFLVSRCHGSYGESLQKTLVESYNSGPLAAMLVSPGGMTGINDKIKRLTGRYNSKGEDIESSTEGPSYHYHRSEMCLHFKTFGQVKSFLRNAELITWHYWDGFLWTMTDTRSPLPG